MDVLVILAIFVVFLIAAWRFAYDSREGIETDAPHSTARGPEWGSLLDTGDVATASANASPRQESPRVPAGAKAD